jgi:hypothetical protein
MFITVPVFAGNYMSETDLSKTFSGDGAGLSVYTSKSGCERVSQQRCFDTTDKPADVYKLVDGELVLDSAAELIKNNEIKRLKAVAELGALKKKAAITKLKGASTANSVASLREQVQAIKDYLGIE